MFVRTCHGLCNQLRAALSYLHVARRQGQTLFVQWSVSTACPAKFCDLFEPVHGMHVIYSIAELLPHLRDQQQVSKHLPRETCTTHPLVRDTEAETSMYADLVPLAPLRAEIRKGVDACGGPHNYVSFHVRRSDHAVEKSRQTSDEDFERFLTDLGRGALGGGDFGVFVATDNPATQRRMTELCGSRVRHMEPIVDTIPDDPSFRYTSVQRAVCDIFIAAEAAVFKGSFFSSFSDTIQRLRQQSGSASVADEHPLLPSSALSGATRTSGGKMSELACVVLEGF